MYISTSFVYNTSYIFIYTYINKKRDRIPQRMYNYTEKKVVKQIYFAVTLLTANSINTKDYYIEILMNN